MQLVFQLTMLNVLHFIEIDIRYCWHYSLHYFNS